MGSERQPEPEFFIDRSLGKSIAEGLRAVGLTVHTMASVYGEERAQTLRDEVWLRDAGANSWIVLTKDDAIRRRPAEREALTKAGVRVFCLTNAQLTGAEQTARFVENQDRIIRQARKAGPFIYRRSRSRRSSSLRRRSSSERRPASSAATSSSLRQRRSSADQWTRLGSNSPGPAGATSPGGQ
jgi:hypothetical protein